MYYTIDQLKQWAATHETSEPLAQAIFENCDTINDADDTWENAANEALQRKINKRAWELADQEPDTYVDNYLHWGCAKLLRDGTMM